jgi:hypothetical protein
MVEQPRRESPHDAAQRISHDAQPLNLDPASLQPLELVLNLLGDALGADLDAIVRGIARVALGHEHVQVVLRKALA